MRNDEVAFAFLFPQVPGHGPEDRGVGEAMGAVFLERNGGLVRGWWCERVGVNGGWDGCVEESVKEKDLVRSREVCEA